MNPMTAKANVIDLVGNLIAGTGLRVACKRLSTRGQAGVDAVLDALEGKHGHTPKSRHPRDVHDDLLSGLHAIGQVNPDPLIDALGRRPQHAFALIWVMGGSRREAVVEKLVEYSKHKDLYVRWAAVEGLGRYRKKSLLPHLLAALRDRSDMVRFSALTGLAKVADRTAIEPLKRYLAIKRLKPGGKRIASELLAKLEKAKQ
jgi:HEAT repeats